MVLSLNSNNVLTDFAFMKTDWTNLWHMSLTNLISILKGPRHDLS